MWTPDELAALGVVAGATIAIVAMATRGAFGVRLGVLAMLALVTGAALAARRPSPVVSPPAERPGRGTALGYVSSSACLGCHPGEHASFGRTYHRTMTQVASPESVRASLDGRPLELDGRVVRLERRGGEVWARLPDPDAVIAGVPAVDVERRVVLTTGSHREQAFWVAGKRRGDLRLVPFVWMIEDRAFVPRRDAFLTPPGEPLPPVRWASSCIACHAVAGEPRHDPVADAFDTRVAELGVACEACHGPGAAHVERHRDPVARYMQHASKQPDPTIVHPGRLGPERSAAVCGQCHAYAFPRDEDGFWTDGYSRTFKAGDLLDGSRTLISRSTMTTQNEAPVIDAPASAIFWADGSVRVGGREYNGLVQSPCYARGSGERTMTCLSCHAMHDGDPAGQIAPERTGDRACIGCHTDDRARNHSHHRSGSSGSACVSCHMPKTSYALLSAVRSHRIDSPNVERSLETGTPNACNLCHLDRPLAWTARWLTEWFGARVTSIPGEPIMAGVRAGIAGDAGVRALIADALGSEDARAACRPAFQASLLEEMQRDPYAAVRFIVQRSRRSLERARRSAAGDARDPRLAGGDKLDPELLRALLAARDERAITIAE